MKNQLPSPFFFKNNKSGVAIMMALFTVMIISFLAAEMGYESRLEYEFSRAGIAQTKAYYAAKSGLEVSLFRIFLYRKAVKQFGDKIDKNMLDMIWSMPLAWPPILPEESSMSAKDDLKGALEDSLQDAQWAATISNETGKIDINDLASPAAGLANAVREKLIQMIKTRLEKEDDPWAEEHQDLKPEEIVDHMVDFIDPDETSKISGAESSYYENSDGNFPPNRAFRTLDELYYIPGMDDTLFRYLEPLITLHGIKGINVNQADNDLIRALDPQVTDELLEDLRERLNDPQAGPFKDEKEFKDFLSSYLDVDEFNKNGIPLLFSEPSNFKVISTGIYQKATKGIIVKVLDFTQAQNQLYEILKKEKDSKNPTSATASGSDSDTGTTASTTSNTSNNKKVELDQGRPQIISWEEN